MLRPSHTPPFAARRGGPPGGGNAACTRESVVRRPTPLPPLPGSTAMKRVLLASYLFPPAATVASQRVTRMARYLPDHGYAVEVLTAGYGDGEARTDAALLELVPADTAVHRVPARFFLGRNPWRIPTRAHPFRLAWWKARAYAEALVPRLDPYQRWAGAAWRHAAEAARDGRFAALVVSGPPFSPLPGAVDLARRLGIPLVADFRDVWALHSEDGDTGRSPSERLRRWTEARVVSAAARVVFTNEEAAEHYRRGYPGVPAERFAVVPNAFEDPSPHARAGGGSTPRWRGDDVVVLHTGTLAYNRDRCALALLRAVATLRDRADLPPVRVLFAGAGRDGLVRALAREAGVEDRVEDLGWVPRDGAIRLQTEADVLLALQSSELGARLAVPAKLFEYMTAGKPMLGLFPPGPAARIIDGHGLGEVADSEDPGAVAAALERVAREAASGAPGPRPPREFAPDATVARLAAILDEVTGRTAAPSRSPALRDLHPVEDRGHAPTLHG